MSKLPYNALCDFENMLFAKQAFSSFYRKKWLWSCSKAKNKAHLFFNYILPRKLKGDIWMQNQISATDQRRIAFAISHG